MNKSKIVGKIKESFIVELILRFPVQVGLMSMMTCLTVGIEIVAIFSLAPVVDILTTKGGADVSRFTQWIFDGFRSLNVEPNLKNLIALFVVLNFVKAIFHIISSYFMHTLKYAAIKGILTDTVTDLFNASWHFFLTQKMGSFINVLAKELVVIGDCILRVASVFTGVIQLTLYLSIPFIISWKISVIIFTACAVLFVLMTQVSKRAKRWGELNVSTSNDYVSSLYEFFGAIKLIFSFGNQQKVLHRIVTVFNSHVDVTVKMQTLQLAVAQMYRPFGLLVVAGAFLYSQDKNIPLSEMTILLLAFIRAIPIATSIVDWKSFLDLFFPSYGYVQDLTRSARADRRANGKQDFAQISNGVELKGISFSYPNSDDPSLKGVDISIPAGKMIALVGKSGSGKSSLVDVLLGLNEVSDGRVTIDGEEITQFNMDTYRQKIGVVAQDDQLFNLSIRENLLWSNEEASEEDILSACKLANALEFINELPEGLDTIVGERGVRLSGGQVQRISLARALVRKPTLLILDEATSALDSESEYEIQRAIESISHTTTMVVVAHRLSTIKKSDYIYVLQKGQVIEKGTYPELIALEKSFKEMVDIQEGIRC